MGKVLRLTENDLIRIVKKVINEQTMNAPIKKYDKIKVMMNLKPGSPNSKDVVTLLVRDIGNDFITVIEGDDEASRYGFLQEPQKFDFNPKALSILKVGDIIEVNGVQTQNGKVLSPKPKPNVPTKPKQPKPSPNSFIGKTVNFYFDGAQRELIGTFKIDNIINRNQNIEISASELRNGRKTLLKVPCDRLIMAQKRNSNPPLDDVREPEVGLYNKEFLTQVHNKFCKADFAQSGQQSQEPMV